MKKFILLFFLFINIFSSSIISAQVRYVITPENPRPGETVTIAINYGATEAVLFGNNRQAAKSQFFIMPGERGYPGYFVTLMTIPSTFGYNNGVIKLNNANGTIEEIPIQLTPRSFHSETIALNPSNTSIRVDPNPQRTHEANVLWAILVTTGSNVYHTGPFVLPVDSTRRTSVYGSRRIYQYSNGGTDTSIHAGVDTGVPTGTPIYACGAGKVVLAVNRIVTGNTVIIEHLPGVYSLYYHMDSLNVEEGAIVNTRDLIGLAGSTGLSTGPHLHWEVRVSSENADPDFFVGRPLIDKDLIINKLFIEQ